MCYNYMSNATEMGGVLHILTMKDGKAVECEYDVVPIVQYVEKNEAPFKFIFAGGGAWLDPHKDFKLL